MLNGSEYSKMYKGLLDKALSELENEIKLAQLTERTCTGYDTQARLKFAMQKLSAAMEQYNVLVCHSL